jgi:signal transduction histidine kinase/CheY-like chemotaxis protein
MKIESGIKHYNKSIAKKIIFVSFLLSSIFTLFLTLFQTYQDYNFEVEAVKENVKSIKVSTLNAISHAVWSYDEEQVSILLKGIFEIQNVNFVGLNSKDKISVSFGDKVAHSEIISFPVYFKNQSENYFLGDLIVEVNFNDITSHLISKLTITFAFQFIKTFFILVVLLVIFFRYLIAPINQLAAYTSKLSLENLMAYDKDFSKLAMQEDEIGTIARSIDQLKTRLDVDIKRNREIENQLQATHRMESLGKLSAGIAHDFNNILQGVESAISVGERYNEIDKVKDSILRARPFIERGKNLVDKIFSFSRKNANKLAVIDVIKIANDTFDIIKQTMAQDLNLTFTSNVEKCFILASPANIHQIISNLIYNAKDAVDVMTGEIQINIQESKASNEVIIKITDNGCGMDQKTLDHIYDPFFTTKDPGKGTGLGMSIIYQLVNEMYGKIDIKSQKEQGTTITLSFPTVVIEDNVESEDSSKTTNTENLNICIVDDEQDIAALIKEVLELRGFKVDYFSDPLEASKLFTSGNMDYDVVITDYSMPNLKGDQLCSLIKEHHPKLPVILATGLHEPEQFEGIPYDSILKKPYTDDEVIKTLDIIFS